MALLKDNTGFEWELRLTLSSIRKICVKLDISMAQLTMLDLPLGDILGSVHLLCAKQLKAEKVSEADFYDRIDEIPFDELLEILKSTFFDAFPKMKPKDGDNDAPFGLGE